MKIITISREFGSGGRELGKRMADILGFDYYDRQIISTIASNKGLDENYVESELERPIWQSIPLTFGHSFASVMVQSPKTELLLEQKKVIEDIAKRKKDFIIVGRSADVYLKEYNLFNIFVCAPMEARVERCMKRESGSEKLTRKAMEANIKRIDKNRSEFREIIADSKWGDAKAYHACFNTNGWDIKELAAAVSDFSMQWFSKK